MRTAFFFLLFFRGCGVPRLVAENPDRRGEEHRVFVGIPAVERGPGEVGTGGAGIPEGFDTVEVP